MLSSAPSLAVLLRDRRGAISIIGALSLTGIAGMAGLAMETSHGYAEKVRNQRVADAAALAAALAYSTTSDAAVVRPTALAVARANGIDTGVTKAVATTLTDVSGKKVIRVTIDTDVRLALTRVLTDKLSYRVAASGEAAVTPGSSRTTEPEAAACVTALAGTDYGFNMYRTGTIRAPTCVIASALGMRLANGGHVYDAKQVVSGGSVAVTDGSTITTRPTAGNIVENKSGAAPDPLASNATLKDRLDKVGTYIAPTPISNPTTPDAADWQFSWEGNAQTSRYRTSGGVFVVPAGTYTVGAMSIDGGVKVTFQGVSRVTIARGFRGGDTMTVGSGSDWRINGGFDPGYGGVAFNNSNVWFGSGAINLTKTTIGNGDVTMNGPVTMSYGEMSFGNGAHSFASINLTGGAKVTMGTGRLNVTGRITLTGGGSRLTVGAGDVLIGAVDGNSISLASGDAFIMGDGRFSARGSVTSGNGDSTITFGATSNHYIGGNYSWSGLSNFGAGAYSINGNMTNGDGGGMIGTNVSFFLSGVPGFYRGNNISLHAPMVATGDALPDILIAGRGTADVAFVNGFVAWMSGMIHVPNAPFRMHDGAYINDASQNPQGRSSRCFMLTAKSIVLRDGGAITAAACSAMTSGTASTVTTPASVALVR